MWAAALLPWRAKKKVRPGLLSAAEWPHCHHLEEVEAEGDAFVERKRHGEGCGAKETIFAILAHAPVDGQAVVNVLASLTRRMHLLKIEEDALIIVLVQLGADSLLNDFCAGLDSRLELAGCACDIVTTVQAAALPGAALETVFSEAISA